MCTSLKQCRLLRTIVTDNHIYPGTEVYRELAREHKEVFNFHTNDNYAVVLLYQVYLSCTIQSLSFMLFFELWPNG